MVRSVRFLAVVLLLLVAPLVPRPAAAASAAAIDADVDAALARLYASQPNVKLLGQNARGILVFPNIVKAGFIGGAQFGEGALRVGGRTSGYYSSFAASYGLQAGVQKFGYALFFMNDAALRYLDASGGWEIGTGPSVVVVDTGAARALSSTTLREDIYALIFSQKGLFAGLGIQGTKITRMDK